MKIINSFKSLKKGAIIRLFFYLWPKDSAALRFRFFLTFVALILSKFAALAVPLFLKGAVDDLSLSHPQGYLVFPLYFLFLYGFFRIVSAFFNEARIAIFAPVESQAMRHIAVEVFSRLQTLSLRFHLDRRTGGLSRAVERGVKAIDSFLWFTVNAFVPAFFELMFVTIAMWVLYDWHYALTAFVTIQIYIIFTILFTEWRARIQRQLNTVESQSSARAVDALLNYETVKYFTNENLEIKRYDQLSEHHAKLVVSSKKALALLNFGQGTIVAIGLTGITLLAAWGVTSHNLTVGDFVLINTYLLQAFLPLGFLGFAYREIKQAIVDMEDMFSLLDQNPEVKDHPQAKNYVFKGGKIEFRDVSFSYDPSREILNDISFVVEAGKTVAIVGESGAGKSTISRLLFRFYDVKKGTILIDDQDIRSITQKSLRHDIGIVPQDTVLFNDTIYYNIAYGNPKATHEEVVEAAKFAQLHKFIQKLPERYDTMVGERGLKLSGGEKQRVAIARTLLKKPHMFMFDEATSALDVHTEKEIQKCLKKIAAHHTTLIIAHRLSTITHADEILVMSEGEIVERGDHKSLLIQKGLYADMWQRQQYEEKLHELIEQEA